MKHGWCVGVDIGGTFTDIVAVNLETAGACHLKVPSSRDDPAAAVLRGIQALHDEEGIDPASIRLVLHGTTLVTNAIIERELAPAAAVATEGFGDVLEIGRTWRSDLYDPFFTPHPPLVPRDKRFEVRQRLDESGRVIDDLDTSVIDELITQLRAAEVDAVAVTFLHSYANPRHEELVAKHLATTGEWYVCTSASLMREVREYERSATTTLNAALMPLVDRYLQRLEKGLTEAGVNAAVFISQSNGGMHTPELARERPVTLALSGPVAGVIALEQLAGRLELPNLIGLDIGGTSADISLVTDFAPRVTTELSLGDLPVRLPGVEVNAIGAGGGSIAHIQGGALRVGSRSAGAEPGPAAYGHGGEEPTVTDAHVALGRLLASHQLADRLDLRADLAQEVISSRLGTPLGLSTDDVAAGVLAIVNASMEGAIRVALSKRGDDPRDFTLVAFGGAGALHACELARNLGIRTVVVPPHPGTLSAHGLLSADVRFDVSRSELHASTEPGLPEILTEQYKQLEKEANGRLARADLSDEIVVERWCDVRYRGQAYEVLVPCPGGTLDAGDIKRVVAEFHRLHEQAYAFADPDDICEFVTLRVTARRSLGLQQPQPLLPTMAPEPTGTSRVYELGLGWVEACTYRRDTFPTGYELDGPAIVQQPDTTIWLPSYTNTRVHPTGSLIITIPKTGTESNPGT